VAKNIFFTRFRWLSALPLLLVIGALAVIALGALAGAHSPDIRNREALFDFFQRISPTAADTTADFHLVLIDRESVEAVGPWPWPRTILADIVEAAAQAGAKGVILTEAVDAPDPLSPETIGEFWLGGARDEALAHQLALLPRTDEVLAQSFAKTRGAVAVSASPPANPNRDTSLQRTDAKAADWLSVNNTGVDFLALPAARLFYDVNPALADQAQLAVSAITPDADGVVRRIQLLWSLEGAPAPSIALQAARLARDGAGVTAHIDASSASAQGHTVRHIEITGEKLDVSTNGALRLNLPKRLAAPATSASKLLRGNGSNRQLKDTVVLIGLDTELGDAIKTPRGEMSPAAMHALTASQILDGAALRRPIWTGYMEAIAVMLFGAAAIMTAQRLQFWQAAGFAALISLILLLGAFAAFSFGSLLLNQLPASAALFISALSVAGGKSIGGVLRDDNMRGSFHDTLPEPTMKVIREDGGGEILNGVRRPLTVLACELRLADEDLRTMETLPDEVTKILAAASLDLRQTIIDTGGAADQAEGGRMFAYYNAPLESNDHTQAGCAAALRLIESMDKINSGLDSSSRTRGMQVHLAIGIAGGECYAGPMGHGRNNRYSAIGPAVDMAAFLRSRSEIYGPAMIVDESIYRKSHHHFAYLELDLLRTRYAPAPVSIYALIGNPFIKSSKGYRMLEDNHRQLLIAYRAGDMATARTMLEKTKQSPGSNIALFDIYEERIRTMSEKGVPENWNGAHPAEA